MQAYRNRVREEMFTTESPGFTFGELDFMALNWGELINV